MKYELLPIDKLQLDKDNPRIRYLLQYYGDNITSEAISLALSYSANGNSSTSITALKESIKVNKGIIQPILVNKDSSGVYTVIEGNTRLQIYKEFHEQDPDGPWNEIMSIVYDNLPVNKIHAIRLQCHLVGVRDWDPFSKAKYLNQLSNVDHLPMSEIISYCGGKTNEVRGLIRAYNDMIQYYEPIVTKAGQIFDPQQFSKFQELEKKRVIDSILNHQYTKSDFAKWVVDGNIDTAQNVRRLPQILDCEPARKEFFKTNITEATKYLHSDIKDLKKLEDVSMYDLAAVLMVKLRNITLKETQKLKSNSDYFNQRNCLEELKSELDGVINSIEDDDE